MTLVEVGCSGVIVCVIVVVLLWLFGVGAVVGGLGVVVKILLNILLFLLGLALVAGIVWLFLPYRGKEDGKNSRNRKK